MSQRAQENLIAGALLLVFGGYTVVCLGFGPNARLVPLPMAVLGFLLVAGYLVNLNIGCTKLALAELSVGETGKETSGRARREIQAFSGVAAFVLLIVLLGPVIAVFLFSSGYFFFTRHTTPTKSLIAAGLFTATIYLLFVVGLQLQLYHGILEPILSQY